MTEQAPFAARGGKIVICLAPARRWLHGLVIGALALMCLGCGPASPRLQAPPDGPSALDRAASELHAALPPGRPGHGTTDYPGHTAADVPKAYAMVLLAELDRLGTRWRAGEANLAHAAGTWLLTHADTNGDGITGWGLPVAWDAYDDGSTNPAHTEYTISTAIVIDALLTWAERDAQAPRARIQQTVAAAIEPYLDARIASASGMAPYSLAEADRHYDTFNPAAYLAGQMQRASRQVREHRLRTRYLAAADATMRAVLQHKQVAPGSGSWYWHYSVQQALPNDLPHAGYMIAGIRAYIEFGGRLADQFDGYAVLNHLGDFRGESRGEGGSGEVRAFPTWAAHLKLPARSYDLGFALHLACTETRTASLVPWLLDAVAAYRTPQARYLTYPRMVPGRSAATATATTGAAAASATAPALDLVVNEYEAYLYRGLTSCALQRADAPRRMPTPGVAPLAGTQEGAALARELAGRPAGAAEVVPLLPGAAGVVSFDPARRARITLDDGRELALALPGVPVQVLREGTHSFIFHRRHPDDRLSLLRYDSDKLLCSLELRQSAVAHSSEAMLRAATLHAGRLHVVYYDNASQANWYRAWELGAPCPVAATLPQVLPSLQDPAGSTYEMISPLRFFALGNALWLAGGNMQLEIVGAALRPAQRLPGCRHIVETAATPHGLAHMCATTPSAPGALTDAMAAAPIILAPVGARAPKLEPTHGVPWNLQWSMGALHIDHAASPAQLRRLWRRDIERTAPGGWMEFGIGNEEGRIPWSQIYYLNGLLDTLDLARRDARLLDLFGPLLGEVRARLDMEMQWLDAHVAAGRHRTRAFTVDRSPALFGVQTGRLLLVMHRWLREVPAAAPLSSFADLRQAVRALKGHIEVLATEGEAASWIVPGTHHLRWPKGSKFMFDGMPVPYNHQNEWAYAVLATAGAEEGPGAATTPSAPVRAATDMLRHFVQRIAPAAQLPASGEWDYWWGRAYDGWSEPGTHSLNVPRYGGDRIKAWISFRTIDAMSLVVGAAYLGDNALANSRASAADLVRRGRLYPFANQALVPHTAAIHLDRAVAIEYARTSAPWELANASWGLAALAVSRAPLQ